MLPTYTFNVLTISGSRMDLEAFRQFAEGFDPSVEFHERFNPLCFNNFIELPSHAVNSMRGLEAARREHWSCGSDAQGVTLKEKPFQLTYSFTTFDTVPREVIRAMVKRFPALKFGLQYNNERKGWIGAMKIFKDKVAFTQTDKFAKGTYVSKSKGA